MSDSYSKWCEELEEIRRKYSRENLDEIKRSRKFKTAYSKALSDSKNVKMQISKTCKNCKYMFYAHLPDFLDFASVACCSKLGFKNVDEDSNVCECWKHAYNGTMLSRRKFKTEPDVIAQKFIKE